MASRLLPNWPAGGECANVTHTLDTKFSKNLVESVIAQEIFADPTGLLESFVKLDNIFLARDSLSGYQLAKLALFDLKARLHSRQPL